MTIPVPLSLLSPLSPFSYNHSPSPVAGNCHHLSPLSPWAKGKWDRRLMNMASDNVSPLSLLSPLTCPPCPQGKGQMVSGGQEEGVRGTGGKSDY